uniref:Chitobiosyldiphosphodolichol beta-mannosyltransferase n=1 Tax=Meloidogyne javanica TaxID=6303 RepID=A0A915M7N7_MELJA
MRNATIVVIGDIGHSPRTCNHAFSLASHGLKINIIGYLNSKPHPKIINHENIRISPISQPPSFLSNNNQILRVLLLPLKLVWIFFILGIALIRNCNNDGTDKNNLLLLQNPPGIPTIFVCYIVAKLKGMFFLIDWHNYTFSMFGKSSISQLIAGFEGFCGRLSDLNLCVSNTMKDDLLKRWNINSTVLYDRPPSWFFRSIETSEKCEFLNKFLTAKESKLQNLFFTESSRGTITPREDRPLIMVSSTSWTPDEDFSILLKALIGYDEYSKSDKGHLLPKLLVIITGKGPQKQLYLEKISTIPWQNVFILTDWLEAEDYPKILSCADIGVCLHASTSGFDLPMKVVDMFGSKVPVLAKRFPAIPELVKDGVNGILFDMAEELELAIIRISEKFPKNEVLNELRSNVGKDFKCWEENWEEIVWPLLND